MERQNKLQVVLGLPLFGVVIAVIFWSFSVLPAVYTIPVVALISYLHVWNTVVKGMWLEMITAKFNFMLRNKPINIG